LFAATDRTETAPAARELAGINPPRNYLAENIYALVAISYSYIFFNLSIRVTQDLPRKKLSTGTGPDMGRVDSPKYTSNIACDSKSEVTDHTETRYDIVSAFLLSHRAIL
jgi:hypothetical protein